MNELAILFMIFILSQILEVAIGFGGTLFAIALGSLFFPVPELLMFFIPLNLLLNIIVVSRDFREVDYKLLFLRVFPLLTLGYLGSLFIPGSTWKLHASVIVGLGLISLGGFALYARFVKVNHVFKLDWRDSLFLVIAGIAHALIGAGGPFVSYQLTNLPGNQMRRCRATLAMLWMVMNIALIATLLNTNVTTQLLDPTLIGASLVSIPLTLKFGQFFFNQLEQRNWGAVVGNLLLVFSGLRFLAS